MGSSRRFSNRYATFFLALLRFYAALSPAACGRSLRCQSPKRYVVPSGSPLAAPTVPLIGPDPASCCAQRKETLARASPSSTETNAEQAINGTSLTSKIHPDITCLCAFRSALPPLLLISLPQHLYPLPLTETTYRIYTRSELAYSTPDHHSTSRHFIAVPPALGNHSALSATSLCSINPNRKPPASSQLSPIRLVALSHRLRLFIGPSAKTHYCPRFNAFRCNIGFRLSSTRIFRAAQKLSNTLPTSVLPIAASFLAETSPI